MARRARSLPAGLESTVNVPPLGAIAPDSTFSVVDLPHPFGPRSASMAPGSTWNDTSSTTTWSP